MQKKTLVFLLVFMLVASTLFAATVLPPPSLTVPPSDLNGVYTIGWLASKTKGVTYVLEESTSSDFSSKITAYSGTSTNVTLKERYAGATYFYRIKALRARYEDSSWTYSNNGCDVPYVVSVSYNSGGTITPAENVIIPVGSTQNFSVVPAFGYHITSVFVDGVAHPGVSYGENDNVTAPLELIPNVKNQHAITADFSINSYTVLATAGAGGKVTPIGPVAFKHGETATYTIKPDEGYRIANVLVNGREVLPSPLTTWVYSFSLTFTENTTIEASFVTASCTDSDHDDYPPEGGECGPADCDDSNAAVHPGVVEVCGDGLDNDCNGTDAICTTTVPDVTGRTQDEALALIEASGLTVNSIDLSPSTTTEKGLIISQEPLAGTIAPLGTPLTLVVSTGAPPTISGISPSSGKPGDTVTVTGANFDPDPVNNSVLFSGTLVPASVVAATEQSLQVLVPATAVSGPLLLTNSRGTASSEQVFSVDVTMILSPATSVLVQGGSVNFTCNISGLEERGIQWSLNGSVSPDPALGTISQTGLYSSPTTGADMTVTVRCTALADPSLYKEAQLSILAPIVVNEGSGTATPAKRTTITAINNSVVLEIPPQAIAQDTLITVSPLEPELLPIAQDAVNLAAAEFSPSGIEFSVPATVSFALPHYVLPGTLLPLYYMNEANNEVFPTGQDALVDETGLRATASMNHFSTYLLRQTVPLQTRTQAVQQFITNIFDTYRISTSPEFPMLEGLSVPVLVSRLSGPGTGQGPFSSLISATPVLSGYSTNPLTAGPIRQASTDGWSYGTIINIPTLRDCGAGQSKNANLELWYSDAGTVSAKKITMPFTIQCLDELEFSGDPYLAPNPIPQGAYLVEQDPANGKISLKMGFGQRYRFSEVKIGKGATLYNWVGMQGDITSDALEIEVTGNMTIEGKLFTRGRNGAKGGDGSGAEGGGLGGAPGNWHGGAGGQGAPIPIDHGFFGPEWDNNGMNGQNALFNGTGGAGGRHWDKGSWFNFAFESAQVVYDAARIVMSEGSDLTAYSDIMIDTYEAKEEIVKIYNNDANELYSAGRGGDGSGTYYFFGEQPDTLELQYINPRPYFDNLAPRPIGGGGGGGSGKMSVSMDFDSAGAGGGGGGGGAPTLRLFIDGYLFIYTGGMIDGRGGDGGQGGNGSTHGDQAAPGGGGGGGGGAHIQIMAKSGIVNNGVIVGSGGRGGLSGELDDDGTPVLVDSGFGLSGLGGALRLDSARGGSDPIIQGSDPIGFWSTFKSPRLGQASVRTASSTYAEEPVNSCYEYEQLGYLFSFYLPGYVCQTQWITNGIPDRESILAEGLNIISTRSVIWEQMQPAPPQTEAILTLEQHPWASKPVFFFPSTDMDGDGLTHLEEANYGTNPEDSDTDNDSLLDGDEVSLYHTNPLSSDTDGDGRGDRWEIFIEFTDPLKADTDGDGLDDGFEWRVTGTDPNQPDTDSDSLTDGMEVNHYHTNPLGEHSDDDGYPDGVEVEAGSDPNNSLSNPESCNGRDDDLDGLIDEGFPDTDSDGNNDCQDPDDDNDGLSDADEQRLGTSRTDSDSDHDGITDGVEVHQYNTNPLVADSDNDGFFDLQEIQQGSNPVNILSTPEICDGQDNDLDGATDEGFSDNDGDGVADCVDTDNDNDGLSNADEAARGTNPFNVDTDGDSYGDGFEVAYGSDPLDANSVPLVVVPVDLPEGQAAALFGYSLAQGDFVEGNTFVVGAPGVDVAGLQGVGQAYLFSIEGNLIRTFNHPSPETTRFFATALATVMDMDGDGYEDVVIGSPFDNVTVNGVTYPEAGKIFIYSGNTGQLLGSYISPQVKAQGHFGMSVAAQNGWFGNKINTIISGANPQPAAMGDGGIGINAVPIEYGILQVVVGEPQGGASGGGSAYGLLNNGTWFTFANPEDISGVNFGASVSIGGNYDPTVPIESSLACKVMIGAPGASGAGKAYAWDCLTLQSAGELSDAQGQAGANFGGSISQLNLRVEGGDHQLAYGIGSPMFDNRGYLDAGKITINLPDVLSESTYTSLPLPRAQGFTEENPQPWYHSELGSSVAYLMNRPPQDYPSGDIVKAIAVSAPGATSGQGLVYLYNIYGDIIGTLKHPSQQDWSRFGSSMTTLVSGPNNSHLMVSAPHETVDSNDQQGRVYLFHGEQIPKADDDMDGLYNSWEADLGTDPNRSDTDGDGIGDWVEVYLNNSNPTEGAICGNNIIEFGEECDGNSFREERDSCLKNGFSYGGSLSCSGSCTINTDSCIECTESCECGGSVCVEGRCVDCTTTEQCCAPLICWPWGECALF